MHLSSLQVLGAVGKLPDIYVELEISYFLLRRLLGVRTEGDKRGARVITAISLSLSYDTSWVIGCYGVFQISSVCSDNCSANS